MRHVDRLLVTTSALAGAVVMATAPPAGAVGAAAVPAPPAGAVGIESPVPGGFASWPELLATQDRMNAVAERVTAIGRADVDSGFAGVVADPANRELRVYWKGVAPPDLAGATTDATVPVRVLPAEYSKRELLAAAARLRARAGAQVTQVGPHADGSGLLVGTSGAAIPAAEYAGVPVTLRVGVSPVAATRLNDTSPWVGGARWVNTARGIACSTGFGIQQAGVDRLLSAAHCAVDGDVADDPTGERIGTISDDDNDSDVLVIGGTSRGLIFNNTTNETAQVVDEFTNRVVGSRSSVVGNRVCTSGSFSGTRCELQVVATDQCILLPTFEGDFEVCDQVEADHRRGGNAAGEGDSGGPVFIVGADATQVIATGTVTAIDSDRPVLCTGYVPNGRACSSAVFYEDIAAGLAAVGATAVVLG